MNFNLSEDLGEGSKIHLDVNAAGVLDVAKAVDLCSSLRSYNGYLNYGPKSCPIPAGKHQISAGFMMPSKKPSVSLPCAIARLGRYS